MHAFSEATGVAITEHLAVQGCPVPDVDEVSEYAERCRVRLALGNAEVVMAMVFAQPLVQMWAPRWKFAYTVSVSLGTKYMTEGFHLSDIVAHVTDEFSLEALQQGEQQALEVYTFDDMNARYRQFRNALVNVGVRKTVAPAPATGHLQADEPELHVLIIDNSYEQAAWHRALVLTCTPIAHVATRASVDEAIYYLQDCRTRSDYVHLVLVGLMLHEPEELHGELELQSVLQLPNGLNVGDELDAMESIALSPPVNFFFKPLVALVTTFAEQVLAQLHVRADGSVRGCDVVISKPLTTQTIRALVQGCCV